MKELGLRLLFLYMLFLVSMIVVIPVSADIIAEIIETRIMGMRALILPLFATIETMAVYVLLAMPIGEEEEV